MRIGNNNRVTNRLLNYNNLDDVLYYIDDEIKYTNLFNLHGIFQ